MAEDAEDDDVAALRKKKAQERLASMQQAQQLEAQKRSLLLKILEPTAYERMMNVKLAKPELYERALATLAYLVQQKQIRGKINDETLRQVLEKMTERRETTIEFKQK